MSKVNLLSDVDPIAVSVVKRGANRKRFFLRKRDGAAIAEGDAAWTGDDATDRDPLIESPADRHPIAKDDWSVVYCVVAEPGARENCGIHGDQDIEDEWSSADEIQKAAHRFMANGGLINKLHEDLEPYGQLVENAIALTDMQVNGELIKSGSWYVAIRPTSEGRAAIESGEFEGVSMQGTGVRTLVEKAGDTPIPNKPGKTNWVEQAGGLPRKIRDVAEDLKGSTSSRIRRAVGIVRNWSEGHDGKGNKVSAKTQAEAAKAIAEWDAKRGKAKVKKAAPDDDDTIAAVLAVEGNAMTDDSLLTRIAKKLGLDVDADGLTDDERALLDKSLTFSQIIGRRELREELPTAQCALEEAIYNAFYPYSTDGTEPDAAEIRSTLDTSLTEFHAHVLGLYDGIVKGTIKKSHGDLAKELATLRGTKASSVEEDTGNMSDKTADERIAALEKSNGETNAAVKALVEKLTPLVDKAAAAQAPTVEDLSKQVGELTKSLKTVTDGLEKLGAGESSQDDDDADTEGKPRKDLSKEDAEAALAKAIFA